MPNPGAFLGLRKEFIESQSAAYAKAVASGQVNDTLADIQRRYFKRFPPGLEHNVDPTKEWLDQVDDSAPDQDIPAPSADLPLEEFRRESARYENLKSEIKTRKEQIKRRLQYIYTKSRERETAVERNSTDALSVLTAKLSGASVTKPRKKTPANVWGPQNRALIDPVFNKRVEQDSVPLSQQLKLRSAIYKEMFEALPQAEQISWAERADQEHEAQLKSQKDALNAPPSTAPADRQRVITAIPKLVEPILDLLAEYTGWKGSLIIGGPEPGDNGRLNMISIHFGVTQGTVKMDFGRSERVVFKNQIQPAFGRFLKKCFTVDDCRAMALPADHQEITLSTVATEEDVEVHHFDKVPPAPRPHAADKLKGAASPATNLASGSKPRIAAADKPAGQLKFGPPRALKAEAALRIAPVGVAKDKILEPITKAPDAINAPPTVTLTTQHGDSSDTAADHPPNPSAPHQSNQEAGDISRDATACRQPKPAAAPSPTRSPAPTPPPSRPVSPVLSPPNLHQTTQFTTGSVNEVTDVTKLEPVRGDLLGFASTSTSTTAPGESSEAASGVGIDGEIILVSGASADLGRKEAASSSALPGLTAAAEDHLDGAAPSSISAAVRTTASANTSTTGSNSAGAVFAATNNSSAGTGSANSSTTGSGSTNTMSASTAGTTVGSATTSDTNAAATSAASMSMSGPPDHPPGAATVPDDDALDALVAAKKLKRRGPSRKESNNSTKRKADATADAPNKKIRTDTTPAFSVDLPSDAPDWIQAPLCTFTSTALGEMWEALVLEWLRFERGRGFAKDGGSLSSFGRPDFISGWIKRARKGTPREGLGSPDVFEARFTTWWRGLQPDERFSEAGRELTRGEADWECLCVSGQNGLLSVIGALFFWGAEVVEDAARRQRWTAALEDVQYALEQLNRVL